jgi:hypothetical protein
MRFTVVALLLSLTSLSAEVRKFSISKTALEQWAGRVTAEMDAVTIGGNSNVHPVASDCEIHFGAHSSNFVGSPSGMVLEPMNACEAPFPGKTKFVKNDWVSFAKSLKGKTVKIGGVPRIWPEHLGDPGDPNGGPLSNPNHAVEFHPLTKITIGSKTNDFSKTIYAPGGFSGGVSASTAEKILSDTDIQVSESGGMVEVAFDSGRIGNFTTFDIRIRRSDVEEVPGGHRLKGRVILTKSKAPTVSIVTVKGSKIDDHIAEFRNSSRTRMEVEGLVLFSLDPGALLDKVNAGGGQVDDPIQLILYGDIDEEE